MTRFAYKVTLCGNGGVGKTSLRRKFMGQTFIANHLATIGADFSAQKIQIDSDQVEFQIWDLAGQQNFKSIRSRFYGGTRGAVCVFDLTNQQSFHDLPHWIEECFNNSGQGEVPIIVIGNKVDLDESRIITSEVVEEYVRDLSLELNQKIDYIETSAKTGENVNRAFTKFATLLRDLSNLKKL